MKNNKNTTIKTLLLLSLVLVFAINIITLNAEAANAKVKLNFTKITLEVGNTKLLKVSGTNQKVKWSSSNTKIAIVKTNGNVIAKKTGTAIITAEVGNKKYKCTVNVKEKIIKTKKIRFNKTSFTLDKGDTLQLNPTITPSNANEKIIWTSDNESVATVAQNGLVTAIGGGTTTITIKSGNCKAACKITVYDERIYLYEGDIFSLVDKADLKNNELLCLSEDDNIASVDEYGNIVGLNIGETKISARINDLNKMYFVTVYPAEVKPKPEPIIKSEIKVNSIWMDDSGCTVKTGDTIKIYIDADFEFKPSSMMFMFYGRGRHTENTVDHVAICSLNNEISENGTYVLYLKIKENMTKGEWHFSWCEIYDEFDNLFQGNSFMIDGGKSIYFTVE